MLPTLLQLFTRNSPSNVPSLPNELTIQIVDLLKDDRKSVEACSLVCREWSLISHAILFERVRIGYDLPELLDSKIERISRHIEAVKTLTLMKSHPAEGDSLTLQTLLAVSNRFPNLKELELFRLCTLYDESDLQRLDNSLCPQSSVKTLKLVTSSLMTPTGSTHANMPYSLFTAFPSLEDLRLYRTSLQEDDSPLNLNDQHIPLRTLSCRSAGKNFPYFLRNLQPLTWSLRTIDYTAFNAHFANLILLCNLKGIKDSLKVLRVGVPVDSFRWYPRSDYSTAEGIAP